MELRCNSAVKALKHLRKGGAKIYKLCRGACNTREGGGRYSAGATAFSLKRIYHYFYHGNPTLCHY